MAQTGDPRRGFAARPSDRSATVVAAAGIFGVLIAQALVGALLWVIPGVARGGVGDVPVSAQGLELLRATAFDFLPFAAGVLLCLWFLLPITAELRVRSVIIRGVVAAGAGALLVAAVAVIGSLLSPIGAVNWFGFAFPDVMRALAAAWNSVLYGVIGALSAGIARLPLVVLATVLLWLWHRRHDARNEV